MCKYNGDDENGEEVKADETIEIKLGKSKIEKD